MMLPSAARALSVAYPVWLTLRNQSFSGHVMTCSDHACNLIEGKERLIALTDPLIGRGPFSIVLDSAREVCKRLRPQQPVAIDTEAITLAGYRIPLRGAEIWDPTLWPTARQFRLTPALAAVLRPYTVWPQPLAHTAVDSATARLLAQGACALITAVTGMSGIASAVLQLTGLGPGLTPAGDDYVLGVMAALWLSDGPDLLAEIAAVCAPSTTDLSGAFLRAAAQGHFMEAWGQLAYMLERQDIPGARSAAQRLSEFGASSGRAALAGFASTFICQQRA